MELLNTCICIYIHYVCRLEKRVLVSLPVCEARENMIRHHLGSRVGEGVDFHEVSGIVLLWDEGIIYIYEYIRLR